MTAETVGRAVAAGFVFLVGGAMGFVLTFTHRQYVVEVLGVPVPLGLVAGLAIVAALLLGVRLALGDRMLSLAAGAGVALATAVLALPGAGGSLLVLDDPPGYVWAFGAPVLTLAVVLWPQRRPRD